MDLLLAKVTGCKVIPVVRSMFVRQNGGSSKVPTGIHCNVIFFLEARRRVPQ